LAHYRSVVAGFQTESLAAQAERGRGVGEARSSRSLRYLGRTFLGTKNRTHNARLRIEDFDTTLSFAILWFPIFPIGNDRGGAGPRTDGIL
jgi:hypothetical protein